MTDADELPDGWARTTLGEVAKIQMGQSPDGAATTDTPNDYPLIGGAADLSTAGEIRVARYTTKPTKICNPGDLVLCIRATIGRVTTADRRYCLGRGVAGFRAIAADRDFLRHYLRYSETALDELGTGTTFRTVDKATLNAFPINLPPLAEQRRIVAKVEELTTRSRAARAALAEVPTLLEQFRQSVLASAFRGDLTADWREKHPDTEPASVLLDRIRAERRKQWEAKYPKKKYVEPHPVDDTDLPELPGGWCWATVEQLASATDYGTSAKTSEDASGVPVLRMGNIVDGALSLGSLKYLPLSHDEFPRLLLDPGDLLFNRTNSPELVGKSAVYGGNPERCSFASYLIRVKSEGLLPELLAGYINSPYGRAWVRSVIQQQVGQANVNGTKLLALTVPVPPASEQQVIAQRIAVAQRFALSGMELQEANVADLDRLDQSILAKAFRGELVPQEPADEPAAALLARIRTGSSGTTPTTATRSAPRRHRGHR